MQSTPTEPIEVPLVDLSGLGQGALRRGEVARTIDQAARSVGFFQVVGHGVPDTLVDRLWNRLDAFFALPMEAKLQLRPPRPSVNRGYAPFGSEALAYSLGVRGPADLFEAFNVGPEGVDPEAYRGASESVAAPNRWPEIAGFEAAVTAYFEVVRDLAHRLTRLFAEALGLGSDYFEPFTDHSTDLLRANHYALSGGGDPLPGQLGMGAHTDYGIVTVLLADQAPGLELFVSDEGWRSVIPKDGAFLVNLGDLLAQWTNDHWHSTLHRVQPPARRRGAVSERRSVAFFHDGNFDSVISCLATCSSPADPPRYAPVVAGEHLQAKLLGPRTLTPSDATSTLSDRHGAIAPGPHDRGSK